MIFENPFSVMYFSIKSFLKIKFSDEILYGFDTDITIGVIFLYSIDKSLRILSISSKEEIDGCKDKRPS